MTFAMGGVPQAGSRQLPTPVFSPGEFHGQRSLMGCSPCSHTESELFVKLTVGIPGPLVLTGSTWRKDVCSVCSCDDGRVL